MLKSAVVCGVNLLLGHSHARRTCEALLSSCLQVPTPPACLLHRSFNAGVCANYGLQSASTHLFPIAAKIYCPQRLFWWLNQTRNDVVSHEIPELKYDLTLNSWLLHPSFKLLLICLARSSELKNTEETTYDANKQEYTSLISVVETFRSGEPPNLQRLHTLSAAISTMQSQNWHGRACTVECSLSSTWV